MFNISKNLGLFALVCTLAGLVGCGGSSGSDKKPLSVTSDLCGAFEIRDADGSCKKLPDPPACPIEGQIRVNNGPCITPDKPAPSYTPKDDEVVIYFNAADKKFTGYTAHLWQSCGNGWQPTQNTDGTDLPINVWDAGIPLSSAEAGAHPHDPIYGAYFILKTSDTGNCGNFIIHGNGQQTNDLKIDIVRSGGMYDRMFFLIKNASDMRNSQGNTSPICINNICKKYEAPALAISDVAAHWVSPTTLLLGENVTGVKLYKAAAGKKITPNAAISPYVAGTDTAVSTDSLLTDAEWVADLSPAAVAPDFTALPHLAAYHAYDVALEPAVIKSLLKGELLVVWKSNDLTEVNVKNPDGSDKLDGDGKVITEEVKLFNSTHIQNSYLLDALYASGGAANAHEQALGVDYSAGSPNISVWAPTATAVELRVYDAQLQPLTPEYKFPLVENSDTGIWRLPNLNTNFDRKFYRFYVTGYNAVTNKVEKYEVTDPNSVSLSANGLFSQFVDLEQDSPDLVPAGWPGERAPAVAPEAMSIYEMHVRDFSINNADTPAAHRGKYLAFTDADSTPVKHLQALADSGLTHVHLLPVFDGSSIEENADMQITLDSLVGEVCLAKGETASGLCDFKDKTNRKKTLRSVLASYDPKSDDALELVNLINGMDGYNWNYDPEHYNAPEGSYSTNPDGVARIKEMRAMNLALHNMGLRVVYDVVFPHMNAAVLTTSKSTFEKIVPGYYFRNNLVTGVPIDEAGPQTATERPMFGKFVSDSLVLWAKQYQVDGFRFDQSGRMPKEVLTNALAEVQGVDENTYFYGEAWNDSELSRGRVGEANLATQGGLVGTGIGSFNDKMRDPLRAFSLVNGGNLNPIRAGLAGNLQTFRLKDKTGTMINASAAGAYGTDSAENIAYVDVHDDETLWDWMQKPNALPADTTLANRVRIQNLTLSVPTLSQGVPIFQMGSEMLRSKSMTKNSYNSGDWFNNVDFTMQSNNWNVGLPVNTIDPTKAVADYSEDEKTLQKQIDAIIAAITDAATTPKTVNIQQASNVFNEFLAIRKSSPLFSLADATLIKDRVGFHDGGITQENNVIVMSIDDGAASGRDDIDTAYDAIVVIFNGSSSAVTKKIFTAEGFELHPLQQDSVDSVVKTATFAAGTGGDVGRGLFTVPAYTTAVFVKPQATATTPGVGLSATATTDKVWTAPYGATQIYLPGAFTTPNWSVFDTTNELVYKSEGVYSVVIGPIAASATPYAFKIASSDWSTVDRGAPAASAKIVLDTPKEFGSGTGFGNASLKIAETAKYRFTLDASNSANPILTVSKLDLDLYNGTPLYVRGGVTATGWGADSANLIPYDTNGLYSKTLNLVAGSYDFKIADNDWTAATTFGAGNTTLGSGLGGTDNITITVAAPDAGDYTFTLDAKTDPHTITVEKAN